MLAALVMSRAVTLSLVVVACATLLTRQSVLYQRGERHDDGVAKDRGSGLSFSEGGRDRNK
jgi:hypothetical protein